MSGASEAPIPSSKRISEGRDRDVGDGLAFSNDGRRAFAVSGAYDDLVVFRVVRVPAA